MAYTCSSNTKEAKTEDKFKVREGKKKDILPQIKQKQNKPRFPWFFQ